MCDKDASGMMGRPMDLLDDVSTKCTGSGSKCVDLGKRACNAANECWGFAVHATWGVQVYNSKAANPDGCNGKYGLKSHSKWNTFRKITGDWYI